MYFYKVKKTEHLTPDTLLLTLQPKNNRDLFDYYPGQYATIGFKYHGRPSPMRCFSLVSSPEQEELQFAMRIGGEFTQSLASLKTGDSVFVRGPFGEFTVDERFDRNILMIAGGIGITPFMSMLRSAAYRRMSNKITLLYSVASQDNIPFYDELLELEKRNPNFKVAFFITGGDIYQTSGSRLLEGRINEERLVKLTAGDFNRFTHFICGPANFISGMRTILESHSTEPERIVTEEFTASGTTENTTGVSRYSISKLTYLATGASLVLAAAFIMFLDLARVVPKVAALNSSSTIQSSSGSTSNLSGTSNSSSGSAVAPSAPTYSQPTYSQPTYTYQSPVTSVS